MWTRKKNKNLNKNKDGFTLIEILLSLAILFLIITGVTVFSIQTIEAHTKSRAMQNALENARFAIEGLSKRIRTSNSINSPDGLVPNIGITDNVNNDTYAYVFTGDKLTVRKGGGAAQELVGSPGNIDVIGNFYVVKSETTGAVDDNKRGFVRISITIKYNDGGNITESDSVTIRSGVSLRDYGQDGT